MIDLCQFTDVEDIVGEDEVETRQLRTLAEVATAFVERFRWCRSIRKRRFAFGVADIVGVFLFEIDPASEAIDNELWVVVGDLPSAYLVTDDAPDAHGALEGYIYEMRRWVSAARLGESVHELIPVNVPGTPEWAEELDQRLQFLEEHIVPLTQCAEPAGHSA